MKKGLCVLAVMVGLALVGVAGVEPAVANSQENIIWFENWESANAPCPSGTDSPPFEGDGGTWGIYLWPGLGAASSHLSTRQPPYHLQFTPS